MWHTHQEIGYSDTNKKLSFRLSENPCCLEHFEAMACCNRLLAPPSLSKFRPRTLFKMLQKPHSKPHIFQGASPFASHPRGSSCLSASNHNHKSSKCQEGQFQRFSSAVSRLFCWTSFFAVSAIDAHCKGQSSFPSCLQQPAPPTYSRRISCRITDSFRFV